MRPEPSPFEKALLEATPRLWKYAISLEKDRHKADDLLQETRLKAWEGKHQFTIGTDMARWTAHIMHNIFMNNYRKATTLKRMPPACEITRVAEPVQELTIQIKECSRAVRELVPEQRQAIRLGAAGWRYQEIADMLGCPHATVSSRLRRGREHIARRLGMCDG